MFSQWRSLLSGNVPTNSQRSIVHLSILLLLLARCALLLLLHDLVALCPNPRPDKLPLPHRWQPPALPLTC